MKLLAQRRHAPRRPAGVSDAFVRLRGVSKRYGSGPAALAGIDLEIDAGEVVAVSGPRRSGKTTLLELIGGAQRPTSGTVLVAGRRLDLLDDRGCLEFRTAHVALAPQTPTLAPTLTVYETVLQAARTGCAGAPQRWASTALEALDLADAAAILAADLPADGQARLSVARALAKDAPLLLLDEPLATADAAARTRALAAVERLVRPRTTVVLTTPDAQVGPVADRLIRLGTP